MPTAVLPASPLHRRRLVSTANKKQDSHDSPLNSLPNASSAPLQTSSLNNRPVMNSFKSSSSSSSIVVNDDSAEKASRRKSTHFGDVAASGKENNGPAGVAGNQSRKPSALVLQQQQQQQHRRGKRLSAVAPTTPPVSMEVMNTNFEEWMKLATDNKITANNTWNFALIDYFHDLTLLRNGPDDESINFQKASCTLDGCIKIWTSRVDSVATETGKLLSGLAGGADGEAEQVVEGEEDESGETRATRKTQRSEATLAKSFAALQVKKFDLEFTVDPLFKKTCADFDEGGAMGLLMNHLGVDGKGRVVFDAGDAVVDDEEDEGELEEELIDISRLREFIPSADKTADLCISSTLSTFRFSSNANDMPDFSTILGLNASTSEDTTRLSNLAPTGEKVDFFGGEDYDVGGPSGFDDGASIIGDDDIGDVFGADPMMNSLGGSLGMAQPGEGHAPFDPRRQPGQELVVALTGAEDDEGMFDYFDRGLGKSWAGAEHWKLRKVSRKTQATTMSTAVKGPRPAKAPFTIDFTSAEGAQSSKTLFAAAPKSSIQLPSSSRASQSSGSARRGKKTCETGVANDAKRRKEEWLLPDDMHFSSRQLLRLFLKPKFSLRVRRNANAARMADNLNNEIDENFWAQAAADRVDGDSIGDDQSSMPIPFESQFFHDDGDDADFAFVDDTLDVAEGIGAGAETHGDEDDLWQSTQGQELKRVKPENVHFAKKAKRVDVKRLKDDIWSRLKVLVPPVESDTPVTAVEPVKTFDTVIQDLRSAYPQDKMSEISTSFCFICLLHLANEEGLRIETARFDGGENLDVGCKGVAKIGEDGKVTMNDQVESLENRMDMGERKDRIVGELQALKVYKDPNAGRAA